MCKDISWDLDGHFKWRDLINENGFKIFNSHRNFGEKKHKFTVTTEQIDGLAHYGSRASAGIQW